MNDCCITALLMIIPEREWWKEIFRVEWTLNGISNCPLCFEEKAYTMVLLRVKEETAEKAILISELKYTN